jgi:hypothetical protein
MPKHREWWLGAELNRRHKDFQSSALPTELPSQPFISNHYEQQRKITLIYTLLDASQNFATGFLVKSVTVIMRNSKYQKIFGERKRRIVGGQWKRSG